MSITIEKPQWASARELANHRRIYRADRRKFIATLPNEDAYKAVAHAIRFPVEEMEGACIEDVILWAPDWGPNRTARLLFSAGIRTAKRRIGEMTERQREFIAEAIEG